MAQPIHKRRYKKSEKGKATELRYRASFKEKVGISTSTAYYRKYIQENFRLEVFARRAYHMRKAYTRKKWNQWSTGKEIVSFDEFMDFLRQDETRLSQLYEVWKADNFSRATTPSIDRIDSTKGYVLGNMQLISQSENASKGNLEKLCQSAVN